MARYFVHLPPSGGPALFWRTRQSFPGGTSYHYNLNLLAYAVGDDPATLLPAGGELVPEQDYDWGSGLKPLRPFAYTEPGGDVTHPLGLPIGNKLAAFLNDPLIGTRLDLSLPFYDEDIKLGPAGGGWFRKLDTEKAFHWGTDFDTTPRAIFDVCAAADGVVQGKAVANGGDGAAMVLSHVPATGKEFRTIYQHLDITSVPADLGVGAAIRRGQFLGRTIGKPPADPDHTIHLHFGVAVPGDSFALPSGAVDALWYCIDPWGVYDYFEHDSVTNSNYLPPESQDNIFQAMIKGTVHTVHWRTEPVYKTIPIPRLTEGYKEISRIQVRPRRRNALKGTLPSEHEQFLVWLSGDAEGFLVPLAQAANRETEWELVALLREAFFRKKRVRLEYRYVGDLRFIMAAWVNA